MKFFSFIPLLFPFLLSFPSSTSTPSVPLATDPTDKCCPKLNLPLEERMNFYPFKQAKKIEIVSFKREKMRYHKEEDGSFKIDFAKCLERRLFDPKKAERLNEIMFDYQCNKDCIESFKCYIPRNAVLFYDENNKIFAYFEICFQCHTTTFQSAVKIDNDFAMSDNKFELLRNLLIEVGITYGTLRVD